MSALRKAHDLKSDLRRHALHGAQQPRQEQGAQEIGCRDHEVTRVAERIEGRAAREQPLHVTERARQLGRQRLRAGRQHHRPPGPHEQ